MDAWLNLLQTFGVAVAMLAFIAWGGVQIARWAGPRLDKFVDRLLNAADQVNTFAGEIAFLKQRIETLWEFQLRRATVEAKIQGVGTMNSPLIISDEAKAWLRDLAGDLRSFYRRMGRTLSDTQLADEIERRWGKEIVERVCIPHGVFQGACLLIAMAVAREGADAGDSSYPLPPATPPSPPTPPASGGVNNAP